MQMISGGVGKAGHDKACQRQTRVREIHEEYFCLFVCFKAKAEMS